MFTCTCTCKATKVDYILGVKLYFVCSSIQTSFASAAAAM